MAPFVWTAETLGNGRALMVLRNPDLPRGSMSPLCADDRLAVAAHEGGRKYEATFWTGYTSIKAQGGTLRKAMERLEQELDRRSLCLFGQHTIAFEELAA